MYWQISQGYNQFVKSADSLSNKILVQANACHIEGPLHVNAC